MQRARTHHATVTQKAVIIYSGYPLGDKDKGIEMSPAHLAVPLDAAVLTGELLWGARLNAILTQRPQAGPVVHFVLRWFDTVALRINDYGVLPHLYEPKAAQSAVACGLKYC